MPIPPSIHQILREDPRVKELALKMEREIEKAIASGEHKGSYVLVPRERLEALIDGLVSDLESSRPEWGYWRILNELRSWLQPINEDDYPGGLNFPGGRLKEEDDGRDNR